MVSYESIKQEIFFHLQKVGDNMENTKEALIQAVHDTIQKASCGNKTLEEVVMQLNHIAGAIWAALNQGLEEQEIYVGYNGGQGLRLSVVGTYLGQLSNFSVVDNQCGSWLEELKDIEYLLVESANKI